MGFMESLLGGQLEPVIPEWDHSRWVEHGQYRPRPGPAEVRQGASGNVRLPASFSKGGGGQTDERTRQRAGLQAVHRGRDAEVPEFTLKAILLGSAFGIIFGAATVYLALRAGLTVSASVPIAVLSIAVFKKLGKSTILENNIVQTIGSAGESVAAGVVFTVPALLFLSNGADYFKYFVIFLLASIGGTLGVLFMIPLRRPLIVKEHGNAAVSRGNGLRRRPHRGREGRQPREDGLRGCGRRAPLQVPVRDPRPLARDGDVVPHGEGREDPGRHALVRRDA